MARTTLDIDTPLLEELKELQRKEKKSLGNLVSQLLAEALARRNRRATPPRKFGWLSRPMGARVDISDKEALYAALDEETE
ncbi:MAG TPA: antitoxin [Vicinamibacteria bacterium]|nr:antitoxin [Vicinamibacteria bacterium]